MHRLRGENTKSAFSIRWAGQEKELLHCSEREKKEALNNIIAIHIENFVLRPSLWGKISSSEKEEFKTKFKENWGLIERKAILEKPRFNLFQ